MTFVNDSSSHWPIFVISLFDATARRNNLKRVLDAHEVRATFVDAVDCRNGLTPEQEAMLDRAATFEKLLRPMSDAEYGCALSHHAIYQRVVDENLPGAIVLEDDAIPGEEFARFIAEKGYETFDLLQFYYSRARVWSYSGRRESVAGTGFRRLAAPADGTVAYSISRNAAAYLATNAIPIRSVADWLCDVMPLNPHVTVPKIVLHPTGQIDDSDLERGRAPLQQIAMRNEGEVRRKTRISKFLSRRYWRRKIHRQFTVVLD